MPCYRCQTRQTDPARGASPWKRGVIGGEQVLVCPDCQQAHNWVADLDRCAACGSSALVRALGETRCRGCGAVGAAVAATDHPPAATTSDDLAADVAAALDRVLPREDSS